MIERLARHYERVIRAVVEGPEQRIGEIEILGPEERQLLLEEFNATAAEYPQERCIHELFEAQARLKPEAVAVVYEGTELTYGQLNGKANQLARRLRKEGVKADGLVGILVDRSLEMIVGILAILKAGGAYVPIDPEYPPERIEYMLRDSGCRVLLTQKRHLIGLADDAGTVIGPGGSQSLYAGEASEFAPGQRTARTWRT